MINCVYYNHKIRCYRDGTVERLQNNNWVENKSKNYSDGYRYIMIDAKRMKIHRLIAFCFLKLENIIGNNKTHVVDHINRNCSDNRVKNLRIVSKQQNTFNTNAKGYYKKKNKWGAQICIDYKKVYLGSYDSEDKARNAYLKAKEQYHIM